MTLADLLDQRTIPSGLGEHHAGERLRCLACGHRCLLAEGRRGICKIRYNKHGILHVPRGYVATLQNDPIEKKPFYHFLPGANALTFGMLGCSLHCPFCQNWLTSQALRDRHAGILPEMISSERIVELAACAGANAVVSSYNEPLITAEWALEVFMKARAAGMKTALVSNGYASPEVLDYLRPYTDAINIDLKGIRQRVYRQLGGVLQTVLDTIQQAHDMGFWVEVVTLVVPGLNDDPGELGETAAFIAQVSPHIPWHVSAFHPDYKHTDPSPTTVRQLRTAWEIGRKAGLTYVYGGNLPGLVPEMDNTCCPGCEKPLVKRVGYAVTENLVTGQGCCPHCGESIAGVWA